MITKDILYNAFLKTHIASNGCDFEKSFTSTGDHSNGYGTDVFNTFYHVIKSLDSSQWKVRLLHADGGIKTYDLFYIYAGLTLFIHSFDYIKILNQENVLPFVTIDETIEWLNKREKQIMGTLAFSKRFSIYDIITMINNADCLIDIEDLFKIVDGESVPITRKEYGTVLLKVLCEEIKQKQVRLLHE